MQKPNGTWESLTTTGGQETTKAKNTNGFLLGKVYRYSYSNTISEGSLTTKDYLYDVTTFDLQYSTNCGETLTANQSVYLVGTIGNDGLFYLADTWWTQTIPTTEDGKIYIYIGEAYSTYQVIMTAHNPVFWFKDGVFREYVHIPSEYVKSSSLATVATSGSYADLSNKPVIPPKTQTIEYIIGTQQASTNKFTGVTEDTALYDGKVINYYLPYAGTSSSASLELTYPNDTTTGEIPIYVSNTTRLTNHKTAGQIIMMTYNATLDCWQCDDYWTNSNTYDRTLLNDTRVYAGTNKIMNYSLIMQKPDGTWESFTTTSGTGTSKTKNTSGFRLGKIWTYNYNETINSGALTRNDYLYDCMPVTLTYSTNCGTTLVARKPVYLVGTIGSDGLFYLDNTWWTQTEPSTEDGKVYIYLGDAYSTSAIYFVANNPAYWYKDGAFRLYTPSVVMSQSEIDALFV